MEKRSSSSRAGGCRRDLQWGLKWGLYYGVLYGIILLLVALFGDREIIRGSSWSNWIVLPIYVVACMGIGGIAGILRPMMKSWIGTAAVGLIVGALLGLGFGFLLMGTNFGSPGYRFMVPVITLAGGVGAMLVRASNA